MAEEARVTRVVEAVRRGERRGEGVWSGGVGVGAELHAI